MAEKILEVYGSAEKKFMEEALRLAKMGIGKVNPNPMVGAVVVKDGMIIGSGYHKEYGGHHAEVYALEEAGTLAEGADLFVTLEPCSHYGKTPPCTEKILKFGIKRCFIGSFDPNKSVSGNGAEYLRKNGVEVKTHIMKEECDSLNRAFFKYINSGVPYLFLKCAITIDGKIATDSGDSKWISNEKARLKAHFYRNKFMGIMAGINTVLSDNPTLTARFENVINPYRIVVDPHLKINRDFSLVKNNKDNKTIIITSSGNENKGKAAMLEKNYGIKFIYLNGFKFSFQDMLREIGKKGIGSVLLEGGSILISKAFSDDCIDAGEIFISEKILGDDRGKPFISGFKVDKITDSHTLKSIKYNIYDNNIGVEFEM